MLPTNQSLAMGHPRGCKLSSQDSVVVPTGQQLPSDEGHKCQPLAAEHRKAGGCVHRTTKRHVGGQDMFATTVTCKASMMEPPQTSPPSSLPKLLVLVRVLQENRTDVKRFIIRDWFTWFWKLRSPNICRQWVRDPDVWFYSESQQAGDPRIIDVSVQVQRLEKTNV